MPSVVSYNAPPRGRTVVGAAAAALRSERPAWTVHDSKRLNEDKDPEHGFRAASFATQLNGRYFQLDSFQLDVLCHAMTHHSDGLVNADPTIQTCWDADRLDLGRVGIKPAAKYLSPVAAQHIESAYNWSSPRGCSVSLVLNFHRRAEQHRMTINESSNT